MPRARALRSTVEIPAEFSTDTAMASTPRVIQPSTTSFCLAASSPVGPSQIRSTPASRAASSAPARQLMKYGSPFDFGIMATTGRLPPVAALLAGAVSAGRSPRTSQMLVPATISDPPSTAQHRIASWEFFMESASSIVTWLDCVRPRRRPSPIVNINTTPVSTPVNSLGRAARRSPFCNTEIANSPSTVPHTVPRPPNTLVPPSTTAVMAASS